MRYIKKNTEPIFEINLQDWELQILNEMNLKPFFVINQKEFLFHMSDHSLLERFNSEYKKSYNTVELTQDEVRNIIRSISVGYTCYFDDMGKCIIIEDEEIQNMIKSRLVKEKLYESWYWNPYANEWHAPERHPLQYEGRFVYIRSLNKVIENPNYDRYSWNEDLKEWQQKVQLEPLIYLDDYCMWEFQSNLPV